MIYYVEDDTNICELTLYALRQTGLEARGFPNAAPFLQACEEELPDLVLLDIMLPGIDGMQLLKKLRENPRTANLPIMMLSAKSSEYDKVLGLDSGADDYLAKPFGMMELISRCNALLRRVQHSANTTAEANDEDVSIFILGPIRLDSGSHVATAGNTPLELTAKEFSLLQELMKHPGRAFTRQKLLEDVWDLAFAGETRTVDTHVQTLRRKLNDACPGAGDLVETVRGVGYRITKDI